MDIKCPKCNDKLVVVMQGWWDCAAKLGDTSPVSYEAQSAQVSHASWEAWHNCKYDVDAWFNEHYEITEQRGGSVRIDRMEPREDEINSEAYLVMFGEESKGGDTNSGV